VYKDPEGNGIAGTVVVAATKNGKYGGVCPRKLERLGSRRSGSVSQGGKIASLKVGFGNERPRVEATSSIGHVSYGTSVIGD
jgi:hypothetical protein